MFARKIQLNWEFVPAISHVTKCSFITPTLLQPCAMHTLQHSWAKDRQLVPYPPAALPSPANPFHVPAAISPFLPTHTPPAPSFYHPATRQKRKRGESSREGRKEKDMVGDQRWAQTWHVYKKWNRIKNSRGKTTKALWRSSTVEICDELLMTQGFHSTCILSFGAH